MRWYDVTPSLYLILISRESQSVGSGSFGPIRAPVGASLMFNIPKPQAHASVTGAS